MMQRKTKEVSAVANSENKKNGREALFELDERCVKELSLLLGQ